MNDFYANCELPEGFCSNTSSPRVDRDLSATKGELCTSCGRDTSQPNLLPPSVSRSSANPKDTSREHGICSQCGGLGPGLLDGI